MSPPLLCKLRKHFFSHLQGGERERERERLYEAFFLNPSKKLVVGHCNYDMTVLVESVFAMSKLSAEYWYLLLLEVCKNIYGGYFGP